MTEHTTTLKRTLGSFRLWGIAVGLVISGEYFGWSYGWSQAGTMGFMVVALAVAAMYCAFIFSFTELTTAIPHAGGPFAYAYRAFGPTGGFIAGFATLIEFVFAPPAIAMAIGAYLNVQFPALDPKWVACGAYVIFMTLNILGVGIAATFELIVTLLAIFELLVFMGVSGGLGAGRAAAMPLAGLGIAALNPVVLPVTIVLGLGAGWWMARIRKHAADKQHFKQWLTEAIADARAALDQLVSEQLIEAEQQLSLALDDALSRRIEAIEAELKDVDKALKMDAAERSSRVQTANRRLEEARAGRERAEQLLAAIRDLRDHAD